MILQNIFNHDAIKHNKGNRYSIYASYLENYTNCVLDLLCNDQNPHLDKESWNQSQQQQTKSNKVTVRVLNRERVELANLCTLQISSSDQALRCIEAGNLNRSSAHTKLNTNSSRSHTVFILDLFDNGVCKSRLCVVDLAGSESVKKAGFEVNDPRFHESKEINKSLSVLGRCLESIQNKHGSSLQAPWRESLLTKILWEYLHGKGYVTMIVSAHIVDDEYNETVRALEFAANSQSIQMNPVVNSVRPSTRHKSRRHKGDAPNNKESAPSEGSLSSAPTISVLSAQDMRFINTCKINELRSVALELHKTASKCMEYLVSMKRNKQNLIKGLLKVEEERLKSKRNVIHQVIPENRIYQELRDGYEQQLNEYSRLSEEKYKFDKLSKQMSQSECRQQEELDRMVFGEETMNNEKEQMEEVTKRLDLKTNDLEEELATKPEKCDESEAKMQQYEEMETWLQSEKHALSQKLEQYQQKKDIKMKGMESKDIELQQKDLKTNQEIEGLLNQNKLLLIEKQKLETDVNQHKSEIHEAKQQLERLSHLSRQHRQQIEQLQKEKEEILRKHHQYETECTQKPNTLQETLRFYKQCTNRLQQRYSAQSTQLSVCKQEIDALRNTRDELINSVQSWQTESQQNHHNLLSAINQFQQHMDESSGKKRKRSRQQMLSNPQHSEQHTNPAKKRKISMDHALLSFSPAAGRDQGGDQCIQEFDRLLINNTSQIASDSPQNLSLDDLRQQTQNQRRKKRFLNPNKEENEEEDEKDTQEQDMLQNAEDATIAKNSKTESNGVDTADDGNEREEEKGEESEHVKLKQELDCVQQNEPETFAEPQIKRQSSQKKRVNSNILLSPALSHLSEGDDPLPRRSLSRTRKAMQKRQQTNKNSRNAKHRGMSTPATKEGLYKLRVVDLRKKLKKRSLKPGNKKKAELINLLHSHIEKEKVKKQQEDEEEEDHDDNHHVGGNDNLHNHPTANEEEENERNDKNDGCNQRRVESKESYEVIQSEMIGRCIGEENGNKYYRGITIDGTLYNVGDEVYICNNDTDEMWLGFIVSLFENEDGDRYMGNSWFWSYSEIKKAVKNKPYEGWKPGANEVFLSGNHKIDTNHISLANTKQRFKVFRTKKEMDLWLYRNEGKTDVAAYFCEYAFDLKAKALIQRERNEQHPLRKSKMKIEPIDEGDEEKEEDDIGCDGDRQEDQQHHVRKSKRVHRQRKK